MKTCTIMLGLLAGWGRRWVGMGRVLGTFISPKRCLYGRGKGCSLIEKLQKSLGGLENCLGKSACQWEQKKILLLDEHYIRSACCFCLRTRVQKYPAHWECSVCPTNIRNNTKFSSEDRRAEKPGGVHNQSGTCNAPRPWSGTWSECRACAQTQQ